MSKKKIVFCAGEGHDVHPKSILMVGDNDISAHCRNHGWVSFEFYRMGERISFEDISIIVRIGKKGKQIDTETVPIVTVKE